MALDDCDRTSFSAAGFEYEVYRRGEGPRVGVVGMCSTGGFGLAMLTEPAVIAPMVVDFLAERLGAL